MPKCISKLSPFIFCSIIAKTKAFYNTRAFLFLIFLDLIQESPIQSSKPDSDNLEFFRKSC